MSLKPLDTSENSSLLLTVQQAPIYAHAHCRPTLRLPELLCDSCRTQSRKCELIISLFTLTIFGYQVWSFWLFLSIRWKRYHPGTVAQLLRDSNSVVSSPDRIHIHNSASQWHLIKACCNCKATVTLSVLQDHTEMRLLCKKTTTNQTQNTGHPKTSKSIIHEFRRKANMKVLTILFRVLRWES